MKKQGTGCKHTWKLWIINQGVDRYICTKCGVKGEMGKNKKIKVRL